MEDPLLYYTRRGFAIQEVVLAIDPLQWKTCCCIILEEVCYSRGGISNRPIAMEDPLLYYTRRGFAIQEVVLAIDLLQWKMRCCIILEEVLLFKRWY